MNILFVLYNDFDSNSAGHVCALANCLSALGHDCCIAVPFNKTSLPESTAAHFHTVEFEEALQNGFPFRNGRAPDLLHAWTPREIVRKFSNKVRDSCQCRLFVHMEDNEWHLLEVATGRTIDTLRRFRISELDDLIPSWLSHPQYANDFLQSADGVTVIIDRLANLLPSPKPILELWPSADESLFGPRPATEADRRLLRVPQNSIILSYTGNVHAANAHEVRALYLAVAILNREGCPAALIRTGRDFFPFLGEDDWWAKRYAIELGFVPRERLPVLLALSDVLVQPGKSDLFNDYRFPSKIPEFLSAGRPVVIPQSNIAHHMIHGKHAYILPNATGIAIADAVRHILSDRTLYDTLAAGALEFFRQHLSWDESARKLNGFYLATCFGESQVHAANASTTGRLPIEQRQHATQQTSQHTGQMA